MSNVVAPGLFTVFLLLVGCGSEDSGDSGPQALDRCQTPDECPSDAPICPVPPVGHPRVCSFQCEHPNDPVPQPNRERCGKLGGTCWPMGDHTKYYCFAPP